METFFRDKRDDHFGSTGFPHRTRTVTAQALGAIPHNNLNRNGYLPFGVVRWTPMPFICYHQAYLIIAL